ncbi:hypothetical protein ACFU6I_16805 [Streptomyces sp. NPDC057486]|uniref:hypothetical protein n=1 Tax=Streptomyces sp. NPDC057486 TaxID=3346145 RepID=UPI0036C24110
MERASLRDDGGLDLESYRTYPTAQLFTAPGAVFPACGTGEFSALDEGDCRAVVGATVSPVEAAARSRGLSVGPVRTPLTDPGPADLAGPEKLRDDGLNPVGAVRRRAA